MTARDELRRLHEAATPQEIATANDTIIRAVNELTKHEELRLDGGLPMDLLIAREVIDRLAADNARLRARLSECAEALDQASAALNGRAPHTHAIVRAARDRAWEEMP